MDDAFIGGEPHGSERIETGVQDSRRGAPPAGMQRGDGPAWVGHEHGGAIGDRDGQRRARRRHEGAAIHATRRHAVLRPPRVLGGPSPVVQSAAQRVRAVTAPTAP